MGSVVESGTAGCAIRALKFILKICFPARVPVYFFRAWDSLCIDGTKVRRSVRGFPGTAIELHCTTECSGGGLTIGVDDVNSIYIRNEHPRLPLIHKHNLFVRETFQNVRDKYAAAAMGGEGVNWKEATKVLVEECDETECSIAECVQVAEDEWSCEGGLGDRPKSQQVILAE